RLVNDKGSGEAHPWAESPVPEVHQIRGLGPITLSVPDVTPTAAVLTQVLNMKEVRQHALGNGKTSVHVFAMGDGGPAAELHVAVEPDLPAAGQGAGGVHHVAFRTPSVEALHQWTEQLPSLRCRLTL